MDSLYVHAILLSIVSSGRVIHCALEYNCCVRDQSLWNLSRRSSTIILEQFFNVHHDIAPSVTYWGFAIPRCPSPQNLQTSLRVYHVGGEIIHILVHNGTLHKTETQTFWDFPWDLWPISRLVRDLLQWGTFYL